MMTSGCACNGINCPHCNPNVWYGPQFSPRGQMMPQTVEACQAVMERDAVALEQAHREIKTLKAENAKLSRKLEKWRDIAKKDVYKQLAGLRGGQTLEVGR